MSNKIAVFAILAVAAATTLALVGCEGPIASTDGNGYTPAGPSSENGIELGRINATWDLYTGESSIEFVPSAEVSARLNAGGTAGLGAVWAKQVFDRRVQIPGTNPLTGYMAYIGVSVSNTTNYLFLGPRLECSIDQSQNELFCSDASGTRIATNLTPYDPEAAGSGQPFLQATDVPVGTNDIAGTWQAYTAGLDANMNLVTQYNTTEVVWLFRELLNAGTGMTTTYAPAYDTVQAGGAGLLMPTANNRIGTGLMLAVPANAASLTISGRLMADAIVECDTNHNRLKDVSGDLSGAVVPGGIATDQNNRIYIGDGTQVARYNADGSLDRVDILNPSLGLPNRIRDIKIDNTYNRLYVVDSDSAAGAPTEQVLIYDLPPSAAQGQRLDSLPAANINEIFVDCAVDPTNNVLYVSVIGGGGTQTRVDAFDLVGTSTDPLYGTTIDNNPDATHTPSGITNTNGKLAVGPTNGNVFVSQGANGVLEMQGRAASSTLATVRTYQTNTSTGPNWANATVNSMSVDQNGDIICVDAAGVIRSADHTLATPEPGDNGANLPIAGAGAANGFFKFDNGNSNTVLAATWFNAVEYRAAAGDPAPLNVANFPAVFQGVAGVDGLLDLGPGGAGAWAEVLDIDYIGSGVGGAGRYIVLQSNAAGNGAYWIVDM